MSRQMSDEELYKLARRRVLARRGFFVHLCVYIVVNAFLVLVWYMTGYMTGHGYPWFLWVLGGWGIGLLLNAVAVFTMGSEQRAIEKEYEKLKQQVRK